MTRAAEQAAQIASIAQAFQSGGTLVGAGNARQDEAGVIRIGGGTVTCVRGEVDL